MAKKTKLDCEKCGVSTPITRLVFRSADEGGRQCVWCYRNKGEDNPYKKEVKKAPVPKAKKKEKAKPKEKAGKK